MCAFDNVIAMTDESAEAIEELIEVNTESSRYLDQAARVSDNQHLAGMLRAFADDRRRLVEELVRAVPGRTTERTATGERVAAKIQRWWLDLRAGLNGGDPGVVLGEVARAEDQVKALYEDVTSRAAGSPTAELLFNQYRAVKEQRDQILKLKAAVSES
jgi:uncharacterized protein (TIGR02284 family)